MTTEPWTIKSLKDALERSAQADSLTLAIVPGADDALSIVAAAFGDLEITATIAGEQMLFTTLLFPASAVADAATFDGWALRVHKTLPLSTIGVAIGPGGEEWYEMFGALSGRSTLDNVILELTTLAANTLDFASEAKPHLKSNA